MRIVGLGLTVAAAAVLSASAFRPGGGGFIGVGVGVGCSTRSRPLGPTATRRIVGSSTTTALGDKPKKKNITTMKRGGTSGGGFGTSNNSGPTAPTPTFVKPSFPYAGELRPYTQSPQQVVLNPSIAKPDYWQTGVPKSYSKNSLMPWMIEVKSTEEITKMRAAGRLARQVLDLAGRAVAVGVTTDEIDRLVHAEIVSNGAYPSPLNYHGFPKSCCTSVNEVICHGIPDSRPLQLGDIVNVDITVYLNGYHGDCSEMFIVGGEDACDTAGRQLIQATYDCWIAACRYVQPGRYYKDLGAIVEDYVVPRGFQTVRNFCGHGIGSTFHTSPNILHYRNNEPNGQMAVGHTFTIEPMICEGSAKPLMWPDDWTATTVDGGRAAQFEHTLLITTDGVEALTGKTLDSMVHFWERESTIHTGIWLGTSADAVRRHNDINAILLPGPAATPP